MEERTFDTYPTSIERGSNDREKRPTLTVETSARSTSLPKRRKSLYRRFKRFLSRLFQKGRHQRRQRPRVKKPAIYVFSPTDIDVTVSVTLDRVMEFTAVYPIVPIQKLEPQGEKIQWDVHTSSDGSLLTRDTGLELSSLFWEADLNTSSLSSSRQGELPETWILSDSNCVVLSVDDITGYLEKALRYLGLHTEARTSFVTFWLPSFLSHRYIALRFMPQTEYSRIAPLDIKPEPDVMTRVLMLFQGVKDLEAWPWARKRARDDASYWAAIVGVDSAAAFNKDLSRVLEWGAMELPGYAINKQLSQFASAQLTLRPPTMKFAALLAPLVLMTSSVLAVTLSYDPGYDNPSRSLTEVACSDGGNGLITDGYKILGSLPKFPYIGGTDNVAGWNSPQCGTCWKLTYKDGKGVTRSINVIAVDHASAGWNVATQAMNALTGGQAVQVGRINNVKQEKVAASQCGL
ncbi:hypothetical protein C0995_006648 [Termitomyces sp. Mi166|nr:hypothetical protein C0995_006648 [Termitomyces sp. Mi166\